LLHVRNIFAVANSLQGCHVIYESLTNIVIKFCLPVYASDCDALTCLMYTNQKFHQRIAQYFLERFAYLERETVERQLSYLVTDLCDLVGESCDCVGQLHWCTLVGNVGQVSIQSKSITSFMLRCCGRFYHVGRRSY